MPIKNVILDCQQARYIWIRNGTAIQLNRVDIIIAEMKRHLNANFCEARFQMTEGSVHKFSSNLATLWVGCAFDKKVEVVEAINVTPLMSDPLKHSTR